MNFFISLQFFIPSFSLRHEITHLSYNAMFQFPQSKRILWDVKNKYELIKYLLIARCNQNFFQIINKEGNREKEAMQRTSKAVIYWSMHIERILE